MGCFYIHRSCQEQGILEEALTLSQNECVLLIKSFEKIIKEKILESNDVLQKRHGFLQLYIVIGWFLISVMKQDAFLKR